MTFSKKYEQKIVIPSRYNEKITSVLQTKEFIWIGREDGIVDFQNDSLKGNVKVFEVAFDCLESEDIKERINAMVLLESGGTTNTLFAGNERCISIIKIRNNASTINICAENYSQNFRNIESKCCSNVHSYILNSMSISSSNEYLLTSDYLKVNLWSPLAMNSFYNLVDIKTQLAGGLVFVINSSKFSPFSDNLFGYSTSNGLLKIHDISMAPKSEEAFCFKNQNTESIKSISDFSFINENTIITRSMNNVCVFDMRNPTKERYSKELITDIAELNMLNTSEAIYDKFRVVSCGNTAYTGSYFGSMYYFNVTNNEFSEIQINKQRMYCPENRVKMVVCNEEGFSCIFGGALIAYKVSEQ
ncbi:hypothetical protein GINT2_000473 [Glugoides intestinalis]